MVSPARSYVIASAGTGPPMRAILDPSITIVVFRSTFPLPSMIVGAFSTTGRGCWAAEVRTSGPRSNDERSNVESESRPSVRMTDILWRHNHLINGLKALWPAEEQGRRLLKRAEDSWPRAVAFKPSVSEDPVQPLRTLI